MILRNLLFLLSIFSYHPWVYAQAYPSRPVRMVVAFAPGGAPDILARIAGQRLTEKLGQPVIVDNRPGATGNVGAEIVAKAQPDGYTLFMATVSVAISPSVYTSLAFKVPESFAPVSMAASVPLILVVHPSLPVKSVSDLIQLAKDKPKQLNYASVGVGSPQHLAGELFRLRTGAGMVHVAYKGGGPANTALLAGESHVYFSGMPPALPHVKAGRLRALAVTTRERSPSAPDVPTAAEAGLQNFEVDNWHAVLAPATTQAAIVARLNKDLTGILAEPAVRQQFVQQGALAQSSTPQMLAAFMREEVRKWNAVIKQAGITIE